MRRAQLFFVLPLTVLAAGGLPWLKGFVSDQPLARTEQARRSPVSPVSLTGHPLEPVLDLARQTHEHVVNNVSGFSCRLIKQERIDGHLQQQRAIEMRVREGLPGDPSATQPFSVFLHFLAPPDVAGRRILYREGEDDNKMLVRKGGRRLDFIVLRLDPRGYKAQAESLVPITEVGFHRLLAGMVAILERQIECDPSGANTRVRWREEAQLELRPCRALQIVHPQRCDELGFHTATVYIDREFCVPIRIEAYGWPDEPGGSPPLLAEYTYSDLQFNTRLGDDRFDAALVRGE
jgi:hypothetical protein